MQETLHQKNTLYPWQDWLHDAKITLDDCNYATICFDYVRPPQENLADALTVSVVTHYLSGESHTSTLLLAPGEQTITFKTEAFLATIEYLDVTIAGQRLFAHAHVKPDELRQISTVETVCIIPEEILTLPILEQAWTQHQAMQALRAVSPCPVALLELPTQPSKNPFSIWMSGVCSSSTFPTITLKHANSTLYPTTVFTEPFSTSDDMAFFLEFSPNDLLNSTQIEYLSQCTLEVRTQDSQTFLVQPYKNYIAATGLAEQAAIPTRLQPSMIRDHGLMPYASFGNAWNSRTNPGKRLLAVLHPQQIEIAVNFTYQPRGVSVGIEANGFYHLALVIFLEEDERGEVTWHKYLV